MLLLLFPVFALGQTFDGSGPIAPPTTNDVTDPLLGFGGASWQPGAVSIMGHAASNTLVRELADGDTTIADPILGSLFGVDAAAMAPLSRRMSLGVTVPVWLAADGIATGPALGDAHVWAPVRLVDRGAFDVALVPFARLPTGPDARYLGDPFGAGLIASLGAQSGPLFAHADLGLDAGGATDAPDWPGGVRSRFALDGGVVVRAVALHAELRGRAPVGGPVPSVPTEGLLSLRAQAVERVALSVGGGRAITRGVGAGSLRLFVGTSIQLGKEKESPIISEGPRKEIREVNVIDAQRLPIRGAMITAGNVAVESDFEGFADLPLKAVRSGQLTVSAPGYLPVTREISVDEPWWEIQLQRAPVPVAVSVVNPDGTVAGDAVITVVGPVDAGPGSFDDTGIEYWDLPQGEWTVRIEAEGFGPQERTLVIDDRRIDPIRVDAILTPEETPGTALSVRVVDALGRPVEDAVVAVENRDIGTTGSGGDVSVGGLAEGEHAIVVRSTQHGPAVISEVNLSPNAKEEVLVTLAWQPGTVLVSVNGPDGKPTDATVRLSGPQTLPERTVGADGEELFVLRPGRWEVDVISPTLAPQTRVVEVTNVPGELVRLELTLMPEEKGDATLDLLVVDPDGLPVEGLSVALDGTSVGRTGPEGTLSLRELQRGVRFVQVQGALTVPRLTEVDLIATRQKHDVIVWWVDGVVDLHVEQADGRPVNATLSPHGASEYPAFPLGLDGFERRVFEPGTWALEASAAGLETRSRQIDVQAGTHRRQVVRYRLEPPAAAVGRLTLIVRDPSGAPANATVRLGGAPAGEALNGFFQLDGVPVGPLEVTIAAVGLADVVQTLQIEDKTEIVIEPAWAVGAVQVEAFGPKGPIEATLDVRGAQRLPPLELTGGQRRLQLAPGTWTLSASAANLATAVQTVVVPEGPALTSVRLDLQPEAAMVRLDVSSADAVPVADAEVRVNGETVGRTDATGQVVFAAAKAPNGAPMPTTVEVVPADPRLAPMALALPAEAGEQQHEVVVAYAARAVEVEVVDIEGVAVGTATLEAYGDSKQTGAATAGKASLDLAPGTWTVTGRTADGQVGTARVQVPVDPSQQAKVQVVLDTVQATSDGKVLRPLSPILFDLGQAALRPDDLRILDDMARWLSADRTVAVAEVAGHTDDLGGVAYNQELSERRSKAVRDALVARGVAPERLVARGYGLSRPASSGTDEASRQRNRRVEIRVIRSASE